jgi:hypothetical protein
MADVKFFSPVLSERVGVSKHEMDVFLGACKTYASELQDSGGGIGTTGESSC